MPTNNMKKILTLFILIVMSLYSTLIAIPVSAQQPNIETAGNVRTPFANVEAHDDAFYKARITKIVSEEKIIVDNQTHYRQLVEAQIVNGDKKGTAISIDHGGSDAVAEFQKVRQGEVVVVTESYAIDKQGTQSSQYYIVDRDRTWGLVALVAIFFICAMYFGRVRGFSSILGMGASALIIFYWIIPRILHGANPLWTCVIGAMIIILISLYLSHGLNRRTSLALISTLISLGIAVIIDLAFVHLAKLAGNGSEEAMYLQTGAVSINLQGLLLGGIILGVIGVLDDITTSQTAAIEEIAKAGKSLRFAELYQSGVSIGREHIASLVNTLMLAYVGAAFPLFVLYASQKSQPLWVTLTSSFTGEEIARTLVGSTVLVLAVPLTTIIAAWYYSRHH